MYNDYILLKSENMNYIILLAFVPLFAWALGDFFIQRSTRKIGTIQSLFFIALLSTPTLIPFIYKDILSLTVTEVGTLFSLSILIFVYSIVLFQAFKVGKLSVLESIIALELPISVGLASLILGEKMSTLQVVLFILIFLGIFFTTFKNKIKGRVLLEKGFYLALASAGLAALVDFYIGVSAQKISPFITIWFTHATLLLICFLILLYERKLGAIIEDIKTHPFLILAQSFFDNLGWLSYAYAVTYLPISLTLIISECYIIIAALLGYFFNKEKLTRNQKIGATVALISVTILSFISK